MAISRKQTVLMAFVALLAIYILAVSLYLPSAVKQKSAVIVKDLTGWDLQITKLTINPFTLLISLGGVELKDAKGKIMSFEALNLDVELLRSVAGTLTLKPIELSGFHLNLNKDKNGLVHLNHLLASTAEEAGGVESKPEPESSPFRWHLDGLTIANASVGIHDSSFKKPLITALDNIDLFVGPISYDFDKSVNYRLSFALQGANSSSNGEINIAPFAINADLNIGALPLNLLTPIIQEHSSTQLASGSLNINTKILASTQNGSPSGITGNLASDIIITDLNINADKQVEGKPSNDSAAIDSIFRFDSFDIQGLEVDLTSLDLSIEKLTLKAPKVKLLKYENGSTNLSNLSKAGASAPPTTEPQANPEPAKLATEHTDSPAPTYTISTAVIEAGNVSIEDQSFESTFKESISNINIKASDISNEPGKTNAIEFLATIFDSGALEGQFKTILSNEKRISEVQMSVDRIAMTKTSPIMVKHRGYQVTDGFFSADFDYKIAGDHLVGQNKLLVDNVEMKVAPGKLPALPMPLALSLIEDANGVVVLEVPVEGDISSPAFNLAKLIRQKVTDILTNILASPFNAIGGFLGIEEDISKVEFLAGSTRLDPEQKRRLKLLADVLKEKPELKLGITPASYHSELNITASDSEIEQNKINSAEALASARVNTIKKLLARYGLTESRVSTKAPKILETTTDKLVVVKFSLNDE